MHLWAISTYHCSVWKHTRHISIIFNHLIYVFLKSYIRNAKFGPTAHISVHMFPPSANVIMWAAYLRVRNTLPRACLRSRNLQICHEASGSLSISWQVVFATCLLAVIICLIIFSASLFVSFLSTSSLRRRRRNDPASPRGSFKLHQI